MKLENIFGENAFSVEDSKGDNKEAKRSTYVYYFNVTPRQSSTNFSMFIPYKKKKRFAPTYLKPSFSKWRRHGE